MKLIVDRLRLVLDLRPEGHRVETIASGQLSYFFDTHPVFHDFAAGTVEDFFAVPSPDALPSLIWVNLERIEHHDEAGRPAICRIRLRRKLLCQLEVVLDGARHQRFLEQNFAHG